MVAYKDAFTGFSVVDVEAARQFYRDVLGVDVGDAPGGDLELKLPSGQGVFVYEKGDAHEPASFTILNLVVGDIGAAVDDLNAAGVVTKIYTGDDDLGTDERGIFWGSKSDTGPDIAWFRDPSGNVISVMAG